MKYTIFKRTSWRYNAEWPDGLEPSFGRKIRVEFASTEAAAQKRCDSLNAGITGKNRFGLLYEFERA
jgi:hypothetical protein